MQITRLVAVVGLGSLVLIAGISALVAGQILRPVREVRRAAAEITEHDLSRRIPVTGGDDVADVAVQFNAMLDRIQEAFDAEQRFVDDARTRVAHSDHRHPRTPRTAWGRPAGAPGHPGPGDQ